MAPGGSNKLIGLEAAAAYLDVPKRTLYRKPHKWGLVGYRIGRAIKFRERDIESYLRAESGSACGPVLKFGLKR